MGEAELIEFRLIIFLGSNFSRKDKRCNATGSDKTWVDQRQLLTKCPVHFVNFFTITFSIDLFPSLFQMYVDDISCRTYVDYQRVDGFY